MKSLIFVKYFRLCLQVFRFGWKSRDTDPFMFRMNLGHFTQVRLFREELDRFPTFSLDCGKKFKSKWAGDPDY